MALDEPQDDVVKQASNAYQRDKSAWSEIYRKAKEDLDFLSDDDYAQWSQEDFTSRTSTGRPVVTSDQLSQFIHQVANDIRQNTPTINVIPSGDGGDQETAEILKGVVRNIEYASNADDVYDTAALSSIRCSIGFIRIDHDYEDELSFNQHLIIKRVTNPFSIYLDADSMECDGRDARHATIIDKIKVKEFKEKWPDKDPVCFEESKQTDKKDDDYITYAEYFCFADEEKEIAIDAEGNIFEYQDGMPYANKRRIKKSKVKRYKLSGQDVLEETYFPGKYIPVVPVYGEEAWNEGTRNLFSLIRKSKAMQRLYNYWKSLETELLMKAPKSPVMAAAGQIEDFADEWSNPDKSMVLRYKQTDINGNPAPPPERLAPPPVPTGIINAARGVLDDIKATMGMYNASLGQRSNEQSGVAIAQRKEEGDVATYHFQDNLVRSITHVGRILINAIPEIYDTPRLLRIIGLEDNPKTVGVNGQISEGQERTFDLTQGKYDVRVITGAPYTTRRQEAAQFFSEIVSKQPELMMVMGDLLFKNMDFSGAPAMAERMKKMIDPKLLDEQEREELEAPDPEKMQMMAALQEMQAQMGQMQQELQNKQAELMLKSREIDLKEKELEIDAFSAKADAIAKINPPAAAKPEGQAPEPKEGGMSAPMVAGDDIDGLHFQLQRAIKTKQQNDEAAAMQAQLDAQRAQQEAQEEEQERQMRMAQTQAVLDSLSNIQQTLAAQVAVLQQPKTVIRDNQGRIAGVQ